MTGGIQRLWRRFFPLSERRAVKIAIEAYKEANSRLDERAFKVSKEQPLIYNPTGEPCWYVSAPWGDGISALRSGRVIAVSKITGAVLYDGPTGD